MKISVIYPGSLYSAWCVSDGLSRTLKALDHDVLDLPQGRFGKGDWWNRLTDINQSDLVVMSGPEHFCKGPGIERFKEAIKVIKPPKAAVYHESMIRQDQNFPFKELLNSFDHHFYPAIQDAEVLERIAKDRCHFMPFGVDTEIFRPMPCPECKGQGGKRALISGDPGKMVGMELCKICRGACIDLSIKTIPLAFIGLIYPKRKNFLDKLAEMYDSPIPFVAGNVQVQDIEGINPLMTAHRLAWNYNRIMCFLNLPTLSQLMVTKVTEVMACGTCILTPKLEGQGAKNMKGFEHGKHLLFYREDPKDLKAVINGVVKNPEITREIGKNAAQLIRDKHSLKDRMKFLLSKFVKPESVIV